MSQPRVTPFITRRTTTGRGREAHREKRRETGMANGRLGVRGRRSAAVLGLGLATGLTLAPATSASADARGNASCMGFESSAISPPGSSGELPGGRPQLKAFIDEAFPGVPPGAVYREIARLHEGSHEACDAALE